MELYKTIEHTADIGIKVKGPDLTGLFVNAARAMTELLVDSREVGEQSIQIVDIEAGMREQLLVKWLEELLYLFEMKDLIPINFKISNISNTKLKAKVVCIPFSPKIHRPKYQIKAVTYHNLSIKENKDAFEVTIIFDI